MIKATRYLSTAAVAAALIFAGALLSCGGEKRKEASEQTVDRLVLAAYTVPKEAYEKEIIPAFQKKWLEKTGHHPSLRSRTKRRGRRAPSSGFQRSWRLRG
jgi:ABC-type sulfate transport system substrate-binding protein